MEAAISKEFSLSFEEEMLKHMTLVQWVIFVRELSRVVKIGYGTVTLEVKKGVVRRVVPALSIELPDPEKDGL